MTEPRYVALSTWSLLALGLLSILAAVVLGSIASLRLIVRGDLLGIVPAVGAASAATVLVAALKNRNRPVLTISDRALEFAPVHVWRRKRVTKDDIAGIASSSPRRIVLTTRQGKRVSIWLRYLPKSEHPAAKAAIESWVAEHRPASA